MAERQYPDYYLRKRRRDTAYRRVISIVVGVVLCIVVGGGTGFLIWNTWIKPNKQSTDRTGQQALQREELDTEIRLADAQANNRPENENVTEHLQQDVSSSTELGNVEYSISIPAVKVSIEGSNLPALEKPDNQDDSQTAADDAGNDTPPPTPPDQQEQTAVIAPTPTSNSAENSETSSDDTPVVEEPKPVEPKPATTGRSKVFHVYAGACRSSEDAEKMKSNLSALGFQATIVANNVDYLVRVASLDNYDSANALVGELTDSGFGKAFATRSRN